jgi:hypothetical protein
MMMYKYIYMYMYMYIKDTAVLCYRYVMLSAIVLDAYYLYISPLPITPLLCYGMLCAIVLDAYYLVL